MAALAVAIGAAACDGHTDGANAPVQASRRPADQPHRIVATTELVAELARRIGGEHVQVEAIMGPGTDPHTYKPGPDDVRRLSEADLVLFHGLHLEGRMDAPLRSLEREGRAVAVADAVPHEELLNPGEGAHDPHVWFDPELWKVAARRAARALTDLAPAHAAAFASGLADMEAELTALDGRIRAALEGVPPNRRVLATAHDAFGYFGRRYQFDVIGIQGISTESEASLRDIAAIVQQLADRDVPAVFIESTVSPRTVQALVEGSRARGHAVRIGGELYSDAPGPVGSGAETIAGMSMHNARTIAGALAPAAVPSEAPPVAPEIAPAPASGAAP
ncbi:MAG: zinc ABC transporter substrate-binding protein [Phycisphaerae bacterium]|nr:zinc ABC transporter substrate-binding protein [Phycisphaerae bacterium]